MNMSDWKKVLIQESTTVTDAIGVIDEGSLRIALVVDDNGRLVGTVTDGDIRRSFLRRISPDAFISEIMNKEPVTATINEPIDKIKALMERHDLMQIPLLGSDGALLGLETFHGLIKKKRFDNPVFLMAGGFGTRLQPLTNACPKPLLKVGDKPILENILESFIANGFWNFYISVHFMPEMVIEYFGDGSKWGVNIQYVKEDLPLGTGGALGLLPNDIEELPILMMNGDLLTNVNFEHMLRFHNECDTELTMCVREYDLQVPYGVVEAEGSFVKSIVEKPVHKFFVNAGIYVLNPTVVKKVNSHKYLDMPTLISNLIEADKNVSMFPIFEYWLDIGQMQDFERAQVDMARGLS